MPSYVIIGASKGIGLGWVRHLASQPENEVIGLARTPSAVEQVPNATIIHGDLHDPQSLNTAASKVTALTTDGAVDHLIVNGAYLSESGELVTPTGWVGKEAQFLEELQKSMTTNVAGPLYGINAFLPLVKKSKMKKVVVISSGMADIDLIMLAKSDTHVPYAMSKSAVNLLVAKYAVEYEDAGIAFLALSPGVVSTRADDHSDATPEEQAALGRMAAGFSKVYPDWKGPITVEESVEKMLQVIDGLNMAKSGQFLSHLGNKQWL